MRWRQIHVDDWTCFETTVGSSLTRFVVVVAAAVGVVV